MKVNSVGADRFLSLSDNTITDLGKVLEKAKTANVVFAGKLDRGRFVVFGDDAVVQNQFLVKENMPLGRNLVRWLRDTE